MSGRPGFTGPAGLLRRSGTDDSPGRPAGPVPGKERGAVTAEFAVALPAVLLLLALLLAGAAAGITQLRIEEAARAGARALARGESSAAVEGIVRHLAGDAASAAVSAEGEWLRVTVSAKVGGPFGAVIPWVLTAKASARAESPDAAAGPVLRGPRARKPAFRGVVDFLALAGPGRGRDSRSQAAESRMYGNGGVNQGGFPLTTGHVLRGRAAA